MTPMLRPWGQHQRKLREMHHCSGVSGPPGLDRPFPPLRGHSTARCPATTHAKRLGRCKAASKAFSELPNLKTKKSITRNRVQCPHVCWLLPWSRREPMLSLQPAAETCWSDTGYSMQGLKKVIRYSSLKQAQQHSAGRMTLIRL